MKSADEHRQEQRKQNRNNRNYAKQFNKGYADVAPRSFAQVHDYFDRTEAERLRQKLQLKTFEDTVEALRRVQCVGICEQEAVGGENVGEDILPPRPIRSGEIGCELEVIGFTGHEAI